MKVLIVSASNYYKDRITNHLKRNEHDVFHSYSKDGKEGFMMYKKTRPDLCIIDVILPVKSGFDLAKDVLNDSSEVKIVMLSDLRTRAAVENAMRSGARDYLIKPISDPELFISIDRILEEIHATAN